MNTRRRRRALGYLSVSLASALALTACASGGSGGTGPTGGTNSKPIVIGMSLPLTGPVADVAKSGYDGYREWAAEVNASGGLLGRKVQLKVLDDGFDTNAVVTNYTRLISQEKVDMVLGTLSSLLNGPASGVAARQRMLYVEPSGGNPALFTRGFSNLFFAQPATGEALPDRFVEYMTSLPASSRPKTAAYLTQDDPSAAPAIAIFKKKFEALGIKSVFDQTYPPSTKSMDSIAAAVVQQKPELIVQGAVTTDGVQFVRSLQKLAYSPKMLFQTKSPTDPGYDSAVGAKNTEGIFSDTGWSQRGAYPGNAEFVKNYTKRFGTAPTEDAANSYTAGQVLAAAVRKVGAVDLAAQQKMAQYLHGATVPTIVGPLKWDKTGVPQGTLLLAQWQSGKLEILSPKAAATTSTVVNPKPAWRG